MKRRSALAAIASVLLLPAVARAQRPGLPIVGLLITHPAADDPVADSVRKGLRHYGYEDGRDVRLEVRTAGGRLDLVPALAQELVRLPADVILVVNDAALAAVREATSTIPIVMIGWTADPVALGAIES